MDEKVFYESKNVTVTQSRLVAGDKTYAMRNISSVEIGVITPNKILQIILIVIGIGLAINNNYRGAGIILIVIGSLWFYSLKTWYSVRVNSNSGEADSITSKDKEYISEVVKAVNEALVFRG